MENTVSPSAPKRVEWAEALKAIGIFAIVLGHFGELAGDFYRLAFCFHVQLFFFASGLFASRSYSLPFKEYIKKKARSLLAPYAFFGLVNFVFFALYDGDGISGALEKLRQLFFGVRNDLFCANLWFLPALFFAGLFCFFVNKVLKNRWAALAVCFAVSAAFRIFKEEPGWIWGIDQGLRFAFWYALGERAFLPLDGLFSKRPSGLSGKAKAGLALACALSLAVFAAAWPGVSWLPGRLGLAISPTAEKGWRFVIALAMIWLSALLSLALRRVPALVRLGGRTLTVCCTEQAVRVALVQLVTLLGLSLRLTNQIQTLMWAALVTALCSSVIAAFLERRFPEALGARRPRA